MGRMAALLVLVSVAAGCGAPGVVGAPGAPAQGPEAPAQVAETAPLPGGDGWSSYDAPSGPKLVYRDQDLAVMELDCRAAAGTLAVSGALGLAQNAPSGADAAVAFAGRRFAGRTTSVEVAGHSLALTVPLTGDLLGAMGRADAARLIQGDAFMETSAGGGAQLAAFARACGARSQAAN